MYRIAVIDRDPDAREQTHCLAAEFFGERDESAAFVICAEADELPEYYDCYLRADEQRVSILRKAGENPPWGSADKPIVREEFFKLLSAWQEMFSAQKASLKKNNCCGGEVP